MELSVHLDHCHWSMNTMTKPIARGGSWSLMEPSLDSGTYNVNSECMTLSKCKCSTWSSCMHITVIRVWLSIHYSRTLAHRMRQSIAQDLWVRLTEAL